ncbi:PIN domain-containing protein [Rhizobium subbaraonis]|uniref:PIN domain-containing protein n=1 Tax=Rhizobium subbaraonis TaxID=908946 RepID=A0A285V0Y4_9HYPH|nr:PIN domain-containing protein [Rhizobium subbaraonis]SOC47720.1 PIN domain-containing protein [Rhizobium subbaraonis]
MPTIFSAYEGCQFSNRKILFDTNVWIAIDGFDPRPDTAIYSDFYSEAIKKSNEIVVNDYILGELFNRACRIQYDLEFPDDPSKRQFKKRRQLPSFKDYIETVRDTCLNILDDCLYEPAVGTHCIMSDFFNEAGTGAIDFSDIVIREHCRLNGYIVVSHDADFANCGLDFVTANKRILKNAKQKHPR